MRTVEGKGVGAGWMVGREVKGLGLGLGLRVGEGGETEGKGVREGEAELMRNGSKEGEASRREKGMQWLKKERAKFRKRRERGMEGWLQ